uniref:Uncharacterized protein n=1 Tax=Arundo donax TaxID=35708 RepID=A0A0A9DL03_ARUDO
MAFDLSVLTTFFSSSCFLLPLLSACVRFCSTAGLRRTGKSCRLRWVNYLHPGLRRGRITADEERLILELHERWGSRWSRIARSLPGRTDNEIKNFWRTRTRKHKAAAAAHQEPRDDTTTASESSSTSSSSRTTTSCSGSPSSRAAPSSSAVTTGSAMQQSSSGGGDGDDEAELDEAASTATAASHHHQQPQQLIKEEYYTMDQLWNEIAEAEVAASYAVDGWGAAAEPASPVWEFCSDYSLWKIDDEEYYKKMLDAS